MSPASKRALRVGVQRRDTPSLLWGAICGRVALPATALEEAGRFAQEYYRSAEAIEFSGDQVETWDLPKWLPPSAQWLPEVDLRRLGYRAASRGQELVMTVGCDKHADKVHGPVLILVLFNDGLRFVQGAVRHVTQAGEWFIFNDWKDHQVIEGKNTTTYLGWAIPLVDLARS